MILAVPGVWGAGPAGGPDCPWGLGVPALLLVLTVPGVSGCQLCWSWLSLESVMLALLVVLTVPGVSGYQPCWWS